MPAQQAKAKRRALNTRSCAENCFKTMRESIGDAPGSRNDRAQGPQKMNGISVELTILIAFCATNPIF